MNIVTVFASDKQDKSHNPQLSSLNNSGKRLTYWKCCVTFFATSIRCNPDTKHIMYTNDEEPAISDGVDVKQVLQDMGVEMRYLPFQTFIPPARFCTQLTNAFYRLDVFQDLGKAKGEYNIILDSDCVWTKPDAQLKSLIQSDKILVYDIFELSNPDEKVLNLSRRDMGRSFQEIDPAYPADAPIWYGGEVLAASSENMQFLADQFLQIFQHITTQYTTTPKLANGDKIFDGEEYLESFVYNKYADKCQPINDYLKRIWASEFLNTVHPSDLHKTIWHMIGEKLQGLPLLYEQALDKKSPFWTTPLDEFNVYLGGYLGVPERKHHFKKPSFIKTFIPRAMSKLRKIKYELTT